MFIVVQNDLFKIRNKNSLTFEGKINYIHKFINVQRHILEASRALSHGSDLPTDYSELTENLNLTIFSGLKIQKKTTIPQVNKNMISV